MKIEIKNLLKKENLGNLTEEEKKLINSLFTLSEIDLGIINVRYHINDRFWVECYGKEVVNTVGETISEIDFCEKNYFRFYELEKGETSLNDILRVDSLLTEIEDLEIKLNDLLDDLYEVSRKGDKLKMLEHQTYLLDKMPKGFFTDEGEINLKFELEFDWFYEFVLDKWRDILIDEIDDVETQLEERKIEY